MNRRRVKVGPRATSAGVLSVLALATITAPASAQTIRGLLIDDATQSPIDLGRVYLIRDNRDTVATALSDERGLFVLEGRGAGTYGVVGQALGYFGRGAGPFELERGDVRVVQLLLRPSPVPIEGIGVETTPITISDDLLLANGFYDRMMKGRGQFLTPEMIALSPAKYTTPLLRGLDHVHPQYGSAGWQTWPKLWVASGDRVGPTGVGITGGSGGILSGGSPPPVQSPDASLPGGVCTPHIYVDDVWVNAEDYEQFDTTRPVGLEDIVARGDVKAIEVYWGPETPAKYTTNTTWDPKPVICGAVVIWTKTGG